jgi:hypothetical protein
MMLGTDIDIVVPTIGRPTLDVLLDSLRQQGVDTERVIVVHDRDGRGPAATRNAGWRVSSARWIAFLDDDVVVEPGWFDRLRSDVARCDPSTAATQGRITVPLPIERPPTDWERNVAGLERALFATADMAYRRDALEAVDGFDERFPRAYREDADLALRVLAAGYTIVQGSRRVSHPVRPAPWHVSVGKQAGNADDARMRHLHGPHWRERAEAPAGAGARHALTTATALAALALAPVRPRLARLAAAVWLFETASFAWRRIAPGPRTAREVAAMTATSAVVPFAATGWWLAGEFQQLKERMNGHE